MFEDFWGGREELPPAAHHGTGRLLHPAAQVQGPRRATVPSETSPHFSELPLNQQDRAYSMSFRAMEDLVPA